MTNPTPSAPAEGATITIRIGPHIVRRYANGSASITEEHSDGFVSTVEFTADEVGPIRSALAAAPRPADYVAVDGLGHKVVVPGNVTFEPPRPAEEADGLDAAIKACEAKGWTYELYGVPLVTPGGDHFGEYIAWVNGEEGPETDSLLASLRAAMAQAEGSKG